MFIIIIQPGLKNATQIFKILSFMFTERFWSGKSQCIEEGTITEIKEKEKSSTIEKNLEKVEYLFKEKRYQNVQ